MNDVGDRADDYERRVVAAGGTDALMGSLVRNVERNERLVKWVGAVMVLVVAILLAIGVLSLVAWGNANSIESEASEACVQSAKNSVVINEFLDLLISNIENSDMYTPAQKLQRIEGYEALVIKIPDCHMSAP